MKNNSTVIYGIQQIGIGVRNVAEAYQWYASTLHFNLLIFDDQNDAVDMAPYMGGVSQPKRAVLAMNDAGGGGLELWQYTSRVPLAAEEAMQLGDHGILYIVIGTNNLIKAVQSLEAKKVHFVSQKPVSLDGCLSFFFEDPYGNLICLKECIPSAQIKNQLFTGIIGVALGVKDISKEKRLYQEVLGFTKEITTETNVFDAFEGIEGGLKKLKRTVLIHNQNELGRFGKFLGNPVVELIQLHEGEGKSLFNQRQWGDLGFIHLCFEVFNLNLLSEKCAESGFPFTVRSKPNFQMGDTNAEWAYLEDHSSNLIELVETNCLPLLKQVGLSLNLKKRNSNTSLPWWVIWCLKLKRQKRITSGQK